MTSSWKHFGGKFEKFITFTLWQIGKLLVIAASDDVAADAVVSAMAFDLGLIAVEVLPGLVDDVSVFDVREDEALLLCARGQVGRPGAV